MTDGGAVMRRALRVQWRDMDSFGHVNNAVYLNYLEEARDAFLDAAMPDGSSTWDFVLARVAIDYRREIREQLEITVTCWLTGIGRSSVTTREEILLPSGELAAGAESVMVARDPDSGRSRPLRESERAAFERLLVDAPAESAPVQP